MNFQREDVVTVFGAGIRLPVIATANLPAATQDMNGAVIVEQQAATLALIVYGTDGAGAATRGRIALTEF